MSLNPQTGEQLIGLSEWNEMVTAHNAVEDAALAATALADAAVAPAELTAAIETERTAERLNQSSTYATQTALATNATDDRARANHTGSQAISTVTGLQADLDTRVVSATIDNIDVLTQAAYDALGTPDARTLYVIEG